MTEESRVSGNAEDPGPSDSTNRPDSTNPPEFIGEEFDSEQVRVELVLDRRVNVALQHNDVPIVKALKLTSIAKEPLEDLRITLRADPEFATPWVGRVPLLHPGQTFNFDPVNLELSTGYLVNLVESITGRIWLDVRNESKILLSRSQSLELLAYDQWGGLSSPWEMLAAFVFSDHPEVDRLLGRTGRILEKWNGDPSFDGYTSRDPRRVFTVSAAIYHAAASLGFSPIPESDSSPATWGAKIRTPDRLVMSTMGSPLDLALFLAAAMDQVRLNPLIVFFEDRVYGGVWLRDETFPNPGIDELSSLRKRVELDEIAIFDPALMLRRPPEDFESAMEEARPILQKGDRFLGAIDIRRCRIQRVRPLPPRGQAGSYEVMEPEESFTSENIQMPAAPEFSVAASPPPTSVEETPVEEPKLRLENWKRKLLDLTLRNRLLNHRDSKKTIPLLGSQLSELEDALAEGEVFQVLARPDVMSGRSEELHRERTGEDALDGFLSEELSKRRLFSPLGEEELERRLIETYRAARLSLEESGANTLFLGVGFLSWRETATSPQERKAPILLYPIEMDRESVRKGFRIRQSDDEVRINVTLLEMLATDFQLSVEGLEALPEDDAGIDVDSVLKRFRQLVRDLDRWEVLEESSLGLFSFTKFLMWRDLSERAHELSENSVVDHLINRPEQAYPDQGTFLDPSSLDASCPVDSVLAPMSADSSQLAAMLAAADGKSFVLEGPPGTGKSQTITNTIAHSLARGKSVLFVSEKMAALDVVYRRLNQVSLGPFCLELHSNKTRKKDVLAQFASSLDVVSKKSPQDWEREARRIQGLRDELNAYVDTLHRPRPVGKSVFEVISRLIALRDVPSLAFRGGHIEEVDRDRIEHWNEIVARTETAAAAVGPLGDHPLGAIGHDAWSPRWERRYAQCLDALEPCAARYEQAVVEMLEELDLGEFFEPEGVGWEFLAPLGALADDLQDPPQVAVSFLETSSFDAMEEEVRGWIREGRERDSYGHELLSRYSTSVFELDFDELATSFEKSQRAFVLSRWIGQRKIRNALKQHAQADLAPSGVEVPQHLEWGKQWRQRNSALERVGSQAQSTLGALWRSGEADWEALGRGLDWTRRVRVLSLQLSGGDLDEAKKLRHTLGRWVSEGRELLRAQGRLGQKVSALLEAQAAFDQAKSELVRELALDETKALEAWKSRGFFEGLRQRLSGFREHMPRLRDWCAWRASRSQGIQSGLSSLIESLESGELKALDEGDENRIALVDVFEKSVLQWWLEETTEREETLRGFTSAEHERKRRQFKQCDSQFQDLTEKLVFAKLASRLPQTGGVAVGKSEMGILSRELQKKTRHLPVRKLLGQIPHLLTRLKPCMLMSPLSVAQYLASGDSSPKFDLVIFDEASQIPVWDAIGAIARGTSTVVVGDSKQLPPTQFFSKAESKDFVEEEVVEDMESILDDCLAAQLPSMSLNWHYRSRHESLIAFSNYHYYENRLLTFPSPSRGDLGVRLRPIPDGVYDKGNTRTNQAEAHAVVAEIRRRYEHPQLKTRSLGVVTFSQPQQTLIEDLLDASCREESEFEIWLRGESYSEDGEVREALFVKNLENVQGDERDAILFSIGYGPDESGRVSMNFGPLNRDGGERRLNVAVTRAREEILVFSTLRADQVNLVRTRAKGVRDLKAFLEYAERGPLSIAEATSFESSTVDHLVDDIREALTAHDYEVETQVGCSGYRIDLAVKKPESESGYLLGIECDGPYYRNADTARDRDFLREAVLKSLGWKLARVWSYDWWADREGECKRLLETLEELKANPEHDSSDRDGVSPLGDEPREPVLPAEAEEEPSSSALETRDEDLEETGTDPTKEPQAEIGPDPYQGPVPYQVYEQVVGTPDDFAENADQVNQVLKEVLDLEAPMSQDLLVRRVASAFEVKRVTASVRGRIEEQMRALELDCRPEGEITFVWEKVGDADAYDQYRVPGPSKLSKRRGRDLPLEELGAAIRSLLKQQISLPRPALVKEIGKVFGYARCPQDLQEQVEKAIERVISRGEAVASEGAVVWPKDS